MMKRLAIPLNNLSRHHGSLKRRILATVEALLKNSHFILGPELETFEKNFATFIGVNNAVGVASGTAALQLALLATGVTSGDEVITTTHTFGATAEAILLCGAKPVFVDIEEDTFNIDAEKVEQKITKKTKAILPVHLYGQPANIGKIRSVCQAYKLKLIEDCAQAHGAEYKGQKVGGFGDAGCFSFFPGKNLGALGDGGVVTTNSARLATKVRLLRNHGRSSKYIHHVLGYGERLDNLQAAILDVKLRKIDQWNRSRRKWAKLYTRLLRGTNYVTPNEQPWARPVYYVYTLRHPNRDTIVQKLGEAGIGTGIYYPLPLHLQPAFKDLGYKRGDFPVTERVVKEIFSIPMFPELEESEVRRVVDALIKADRFS